MADHLSVRYIRMVNDSLYKTMPPLRKPASAIGPLPANPLIEAAELGQRTIIRNVNLHGQRTSLRLEPSFWSALEAIAETEGKSVNEILEQVDIRRRDASLTGSCRLFVVSYFVVQVIPLPRQQAASDVDEATKVDDLVSA